MSVSAFDSFITRCWYDADARRVWSDQGTLRAWLRVEAELALAQAEAGLIPADAARTIAERADVAAFDLDRLVRDIEFAQHPFVPVLRQLEERCGEPAAGFLHWGATTQNIFDTASALQMAETHRLTLRHLDDAIAALAGHAERHKATLQAGRTHGQHALPMTFGYKLAGWIEELARDHARLDARFAASFVVCMGGAIGTFAAMDGKGPEVERRLASRLSLQPAGLPSRSSFDRASDYIATLGLLAATTERIAQAIVFLQRTEIGEVEEAFHLGKVGSSTMAQKRNPSTALMLVSMGRMLRARVGLAFEAMVRMDEGDSSATNVTDSTLPEIAVLAVSIAAVLARLVRGLVVHADAMQRNAALTNGLIASEAVMMRLTAHMGRHRAHHVLYEAAQRAIADGVPFLQAIREHPELRGNGTVTDLEAALGLDSYVGESVRLTETAVARVRRP